MPLLHDSMLLKVGDTHTKTATALVLLAADFPGFAGSRILLSNSFSSRTRGGRAQQNILQKLFNNQAESTSIERLTDAREPRTAAATTIADMISVGASSKTNVRSTAQRRPGTR